jgi:spore coat protein CotF
VSRFNQQNTQVSRDTVEQRQNIGTLHNSIISTKMLTVIAICMDITTELYEYQENVATLLKKG